MQTNPGLQKLVLGAIGLPTGSLMVLVCGAEMFTGNVALLTAAVRFYWALLFQSLGLVLL